mmetsp:Transcript_24065/g.75402  ORF Transcript_24065/g.75402 Transcript_24065/m.75402 type:complete len:92 (+) Transcript_24065:68-343(+)
MASSLASPCPCSLVGPPAGTGRRAQRPAAARSARVNKPLSLAVWAQQPPCEGERARGREAVMPAKGALLATAAAAAVVAAVVGCGHSPQID